jgi:hypothetical protein
MRIHTRVVIDMATLEILEDEFQEYEGPVDLCGGGGGGGMKGGSSPHVETYEAEETPTYEEEGEPTAKAVRDEEAARLKRKRGAAGTILTSPLGTTGGGNLLGG